MRVIAETLTYINLPRHLTSSSRLVLTWSSRLLLDLVISSWFLYNTGYLTLSCASLVMQDDIRYSIPPPRCIRSTCLPFGQVMVVRRLYDGRHYRIHYQTLCTMRIFVPRSGSACRLIRRFRISFRPDRESIDISTPQPYIPYLIAQLASVTRAQHLYPQSFIEYGRAVEQSSKVMYTTLIRS